MEVGLDQTLLRVITLSDLKKESSANEFFLGMNRLRYQMGIDALVTRIAIQKFVKMEFAKQINKNNHIV